MLVLLVCAVTAAGARYLVQGLAGGTPGRASFVIATLVLPMLLLLAVHFVQLASSTLRRRRRRRPK
jgi:hypothetical protein